MNSLETLFYKAQHGSQAERIQIVREKKSELGKTNRFGIPLAHFLVMMNDHMVHHQMMLDENILKIKDENDVTTAHVLAGHGNEEILEMLAKNERVLKMKKRNNETVAYMVNNRASPKVKAQLKETLGRHLDKLTAP